MIPSLLFRPLFVLALFMLTVSGCLTNADQSERPGAQIPEQVFLDSARVAHHPAFSGRDSLWKVELLAWYAEKDWQAAWFRNGAAVEQAAWLLNMCREWEGEQWFADTAIALAAELDNLDTRSPEEWTERIHYLDISLSVLFLNYAQTQWMGIPENNRRQTGWMIQGGTKNPISLLEDFLGNGDHAAFQRKAVYSQMDRLAPFLKQYRQIQAEGGWPRIQEPEKDWVTGDSATGIRDMRTLLYIVGDLPENSGSAVLDSLLQIGIRSFQRRHGLHETGLPDRLTLRAMGYTVEDRIRQILLNMERCRWVPPEPEETYIAVNIPDFRMMVFQNKQLLWSCKAVVGKQKTGTVIFNNQLQMVVFNPYWNVPRSILVNEVLPKQARDPGYLARQNMEVYAANGKVVSTTGLNWHAGASFPYNIRQKPGPNNSLGRIKFLFPNEHNIYLHDTPAKNLFAEPVRAFSHGCIRIQEPLRLARFLLKDDPEWTEEKIQDALASGKETTVTLKHPVPVFIAYFTAFTDNSGKINFREDIYRHDARLGQILFPEEARLK